MAGDKGETYKDRDIREWGTDDVWYCRSFREDGALDKGRRLVLVYHVIQDVTAVTLYSVLHLCYTEHMKPTKPIRKVARPPILGEESIQYQSPQITIYAHREGNDSPSAPSSPDLPGALDSRQPGKLGQAGQEVEGEGQAEMTGGRSEFPAAAPLVTAKPLSAISSSSSKSPNKPLLKVPSPKSPLNPDSDMPVSGDLGGVGEELGGRVVHSYGQVPFTPENEPPFDTNESKVSSPFITGNERIDRRTAFTQYCRLGEGRTYIKVAEVMAVPLESIKKWANEDNWENAYRERVTADILQVAKEENIHEVLDIRREVIAQLKAKITEAKNGKEVFKNTKEMLDTMLKLEELTGASTANSVRAGQIFVIIDKEAWEEREKMNEKARKEEAGV
jgi:hypothetical protein